MRRLVLLTLLALIVLGATFPASAQDDDLRATVETLQTQVAALQTQVAVLSTAEAGSTESGIAVTTTAPTPTTAASVGMPGIGDTVQMDDFEFYVATATTKDSMEDSTGFLSWEPDNGLFLVLDLRVRNISQRSQEFPAMEFVVTEKYGAEFSPLWTASIYFGNDFDTSGPIISGGTYIRNLVFDIPPAAGNLVLSHEDYDVAISLET